MSNQIFKSINNSIEFYENQLLKSENNIDLILFSQLKELTINKVEILKKLLELVGDNNDNHYEDFYNNNFKDFKLKQMYTFNDGLYKFMSFTDINDFIKKIKDYEWIDGKNLMNEINIVLDNIKKLPEIKQKKINVK